MLTVVKYNGRLLYLSTWDKNKYIKVVAKSCTVTLTGIYTKLPFSQLSFL